MEHWTIRSVSVIPVTESSVSRPAAPGRRVTWYIILDEIIDKSVRQIFSKMRGIPKEQIITRRYEREVVERKNHLQTIQVERDKAQKDLISLKAEILACIKGESVFPKETLAEMITAQEEKLRELDALYESSYAETEKTAELMDSVSKTVRRTDFFF